MLHCETAGRLLDIPAGRILAALPLKPDPIMTALPATAPLPLAVRLALPLLLLGAVGIAFSPIFVRLSEVGPTATGFWRVGLAVPLLSGWLWSQPAVARGAQPANGHDFWLIFLVAFCFAGDLALWHWSLKLTSVANSTLLANVAPIFVAFGARAMFGERLTLNFIAGMAVAMAGALILMGSSFSLDWSHVAGDALGVGTAVFYAGYMLALKRARERFSTLTLMAYSGLFSALLLLPLALASDAHIVPGTVHGWLMIIGLAWVSQVAGQSLIAFSSAHLAASLSSIALLLQPVVAALLAWALLGERLGANQMIGGLVVLFGIALVRRARG